MHKIKLSHLALFACFAAATVACKDDDETLPGDTTAPTVTIDVDRAFLLANGTATITAQAQDEANGSGIARVEFYNGSTKLGEDTSSPYTYTFTAGEAYTNADIIAMAIDKSDNTSQASDAVTIRVGERIEAESGTLVKAEGSGAFWEARDNEGGNQHYAFVNEPESGADIPVTVPEAGNYIIALVAATDWNDPVTARFSVNGGEFQEVSVPKTGWVTFGVYPGGTPVALTAGENMVSVRKGEWFHHLDAIEVYKQ